MCGRTFPLRLVQTGATILGLSVGLWIHYAQHPIADDRVAFGYPVVPGSFIAHCQEPRRNLAQDVTRLGVFPERERVIPAENLR